MEDDGRRREVAILLREHAGDAEAARRDHWVAEPTWKPNSPIALALSPHQIRAYRKLHFQLEQQIEGLDGSTLFY